ncbi:MAG TPA: transglutaminase family protein [Methanocella sp.]|nr:transglutaminase family protein [Methanocella sp.]
MRRISPHHLFTSKAGSAIDKYLAETPILNYTHPAISSLIQEQGWRSSPEAEKIGRIYDFVKDEVLFGYNEADTLRASDVLREGYGQCNTKASLFMALLRAVGVPCRFHGFTIDKRLQKGAIDGLFYRLTPEEIIHSWVEVNYNGTWVNLEGLILDQRYLGSLQKKFPACEGSFCGYGVATDNFKNPHVNWTGGDTYIQKEGIARNFGVYDSPDDFYRDHGENLSGLKNLLFKHLFRHLMNRNLNRIRADYVPLNTNQS